MRLPLDMRLSESVAHLQAVVDNVNGEVTQSTSKKHYGGQDGDTLLHVPGRLVGLSENKFDTSVGGRYLYQSGDLDEGGRSRAFDESPAWAFGYQVWGTHAILFA